MRIRYLFYSILALSFLGGCVESQRFDVLENRVAAIEMENNRLLSLKKEKLDASTIQNEQNQAKLKTYLDDIEKKIKESPIGQEEYAEIKYDIQTIKEDLQRLEGMIEEINHTFSEFYQKDGAEFEKRFDRLDQAISRNYEKVIRLEEYMGFEPSAAGENNDKISSSKETGKDAEKELYGFAKKLFDDGDKENARIQFENFINKYPDSKNADNARFWIADSYYTEKWFEKAILEYQKVLEEYPKSNKLAAARLKQGYAFAELGEKANARLILKELIKKHPGSNEAKYAKEKLKSLK